MSTAGMAEDCRVTAWGAVLGPVSDSIPGVGHTHVFVGAGAVLAGACDVSGGCMVVLTAG